MSIFLYTHRDVTAPSMYPRFVSKNLDRRRWPETFLDADSLQEYACDLHEQWRSDKKAARQDVANDCFVASGPGTDAPTPPPPPPPPDSHPPPPSSPPPPHFFDLSFIGLGAKGLCCGLRPFEVQGLPSKTTFAGLGLATQHDLVGHDPLRFRVCNLT